MDETGTIYDTEAQSSNTHNLPKRSRYYQGIIDMKLLKPGSVNFNDINDVIIILITPFDLFGLNLYQYTFEMRCRERKDLVLQDGALHIFLNSHGKEKNGINPELIELLKYMEDTSEKTLSHCSSEKIHRLHKRIENIRNSEEVNVKYMQAWEEKVMDREEGREEGRKEGKAVGRKEERELLSKLTDFLISNGRQDELPKAIKDEDYQQKLLKEMEAQSST